MEHSHTGNLQVVFGDQSGGWATIFYAIVVTIIAVVATIMIGAGYSKKQELKSRRAANSALHV